MKDKRLWTAVGSWKKGEKLFSKMVQSIKVSGQATKNMAMEFKYGQMEQGMRDTGSTIKHVGKANSGMLMETFLKENGKMTRPMGMGFMCT